MSAQHLQDSVGMPYGGLAFAHLDLELGESLFGSGVGDDPGVVVGGRRLDRLGRDPSHLLSWYHERARRRADR